MSKIVKTFVISKHQVNCLRELARQNGNPDSETIKGSELAHSWKAINMPEHFSKAKNEQSLKDFPYFAGYPLQDQVAPAKEPTEVPAPEATSEMSAPSEKKGKKTKTEEVPA